MLRSLSTLAHSVCSPLASCSLSAPAPAVTWRIADVDVSPPASSSLSPLAHAPPASYEVALLDVVFDRPVFYRGLALPDLEAFLADAHSNHRVLGDLLRLRCERPPSANNNINAAHSNHANVTLLSTDPRAAAHTGGQAHYLVPLAAAPASKFPWLRALSGLAAHAAPAAPAAAALAAADGAGLHSRGPVNWSRLTLAVLLTSWQQQHAPAAPAMTPASAFAAGGSGLGAAVSGSRALRAQPLRRQWLSASLLEGGHCQIEFPSAAPVVPVTASSSSSSGARSAAASAASAAGASARLQARAAGTAVAAGAFPLSGGLAALRRRRLAATSAATEAPVSASGGGGAHSSFLEVGAATGMGATTGAGVGLSLLTASAVGVPFLSTLLAPITSFIQENVARRVPEFVKFRIKTDLTKRAVQAAVSSQLHGGADGDEVAEPVSALMELRARATDELAGDDARYSHARPQRTAVGSTTMSLAQYLASPLAADADEGAVVDGFWAGAEALREGLRGDFESLMEVDAAAEARARARMKAHAQGQAQAGFPKMDGGMGAPPPGSMVSAWNKPGAPQGEPGDRTMMKPDGCVVKGLTATIIHTVSSLVTIGVTQALVANTQHTLTSGISPEQVAHIIPELVEALPRALIPLCTAAMNFIVPATVKRLVPPLVVKHSTAALTDTLTRGLVHVLAPTLSHTLRDAGRTEPVCYYCHHVDPRYCYLCPRDRPVPQSVQGHLDLYTVDFFADYYSDYYADYYNGRQPLASAYKKPYFHPGGPQQASNAT